MVNGLLVANVGVASVKLPVFVINAPPDPEVNVIVPVFVVNIGVPIEPILPVVVVGTLKVIPFAVMPPVAPWVMLPGVKGAVVVEPIINEVAVVPELIVTPFASVMFPAVVSVSPTGLPVLTMDLSADVAVLLFAVIVMTPLFVETLALTKILRPAVTVSVLPLVPAPVIVSALLNMTSELACKVILADAAAVTMLAGVRVFVPLVLLANKLLDPAL